MKGIKALLLAATLLFPLTASAQTLEEYLSLRRQNGISQSTGPAALDTFVGERVMEIRGTAKGAIGSILILDNPGGQEVYIKSERIADWLKTGSQSVRVLVKAMRPSETSLITAELIAAVSEAAIATWEAREAAKPKPRAAPKPAPPARGPASRQGTRVQSKSGINAITGAKKGQPRTLSPDVRELVPVYADFIQGRNRRLPRARAVDIAESILEFSVHFGVDARLVVALVITESNFNPNAVSHAGARGLGQLMPGTASMLGVSNSFNTDQNLYGTTKLLRQHLDKYTSRTGDSYRALVLALAAYNAGPGAVSRHGGVPPYRETQNYVRKVIATYKRLIGEE
jgi:soluble lytic murein transglycosylase-like protein